MNDIEIKINKTIIKISLGIISAIVLIALIMMIDGCTDAQSFWKSNYDNCKKTSRIEYVLPFYTFGCWLGSVPNENK